jgi:predicted DCC family thiol-disulfide oxidoreductase YuxK
MNKDLPKLTLFYDGLCPLCEAEIVFLSRRNQKQLLAFVDINSVQFEPERVGLTCQQALLSMYGQYDSGELIQGVPVFAAAYRLADLKTLAWLFSRPLLQPVFGIGYRFFAKYRHQISGLIGPTIRRLVG